MYRNFLAHYFHVISLFILFKLKYFAFKIVIIFLRILVLTYILDAQKNRLIEMVLLSNLNICFG